MNALPLLSIAIFLPLMGAFFILFIRGDEVSVARNAKAVGLLTSSATFILSLGLLYYFDFENSAFQFVEQKSWLAAYGIHYYIGLDGVSLALMLLSTLLIPIAILASWNTVTEKVPTYVVAFLILETTMIGTFCSLDLVLFYIFFEAVLIPMYLIIGIWGGERRVYASLKFFLYTLLGSVLLLLAILYIYHVVGGTAYEQVTAYSFAQEAQRWLWLAFFASFAVKVPMWPFHTWLPDAHVEAPTAGSVILAGVLLKLGGYGFLRFSLPLFPEASTFFSTFIFYASMIAVVYTSLVAMVQKDMKKLIAYSSVAHMGFVTFGLFTFSVEGLQGAMFQMLSHGFVSAALFLCVGVLYDRCHTREIAAFGGVVQVMPAFSVLFMIFTLASVGLPGTSGFIGEFLILMAAFKVSGLYAFLMGLGLILGAGYALWLYRRVVFGALQNESLKRLSDLSGIERATLGVLAVLTLFFGVYPQPILSLTQPAIDKIAAPYQQKVILDKDQTMMKQEMKSHDVTG